MKKKIIFLTDGSKNPNLPSRRLRVYELLPYLKKTFDTECYSLPRNIIQFLKLRKKILNGDVLFIQKELPSYIVLLLLKLCNIPIIYDFDDAVYIRHSPEKRSFRKSNKLKNRFIRISKNADLIIAGNHNLELAAKNNGAKFTAILPTGVKIEDRKKLSKNNKITKIGWIGQKINLPYLEEIENVFRSLESKNVKFKLEVMSNKPPEFKKFKNFTYVNWSKEKEAFFLQSIDIGIMPLKKNMYTEGKCAYKALQYMGYKKPVVVSDVG